jgi:diaminohydroxyphosphoribosylaminopyrimidine deaminase/5-amino-6-(5-phosphoribosylamino)uracil reductase
VIRRLITIEDRSAEFPVIAIGNAWSREYYDGPFHLFQLPDRRPALSLVFVQSRDGNTAADNPADLGGGPTDKYLIYEGLSRVAADGVMAGAATIGTSVFFGIIHPELVKLRHELGLPRHPAQIVVSDRGNIDLSARVFSTPDVPVFLLAGEECIEKTAADLRARRWITMIPIDGDLPAAVLRLRRDHGLSRISAVGGRTLATSLVDAGLVQDIYLTTSAIDAGEPNTPWYVGETPPQRRLVVSKKEDTTEAPILFEHLALDR